MGRKQNASQTPSLFGIEEPTLATNDEPEFPLPAEIGATWLAALAPETRQPYWNPLQRFIAEERASYTVHPPPGDLYTAFRHTPLDEVRVILLGQDPYPGAGQAHGLCFSV